MFDEFDEDVAFQQDTFHFNLYLVHIYWTFYVTSISSITY